MVKKLRRKFVGVSMLAVFAVLTLIMGIINTVNFLNVVSRAEDRIAFITENGDRLPLLRNDRQTDDTGEPPAPPDDNQTATGNTQPENNLPESFREKQGFRLPGGNELGEEAAFDSRFFTVTLSADGTVTKTDLGSIAAVDETQAVSLAQQVRAAGRTKGFTGNYRYLATAADNATTYLFLDCTRELDTFYSFLYASVLVSLIGLILIFLLVLPLSKTAIRPMAESHEKQKRFITDASHELKTPLAVIQADTEVLELTDGENEWTNSIKNQVKRLNSLTEKLVMLSRMDEESYKPVTTDFNLSNAVAEIASSFDAVAVSRNRNYEKEVAPGLHMHGEESAVRQLCSLLIDNAMKYSNEGGTVRVTLHENGKKNELTVFNTVDEIKKGNNDVLFERFYRADTSRASRTGGHGIGLSVAHAIVAAHKGKITAFSDDGKSIRFTCLF